MKMDENVKKLMTSDSPEVITSLDLEFNQPSGKIIQIGAVIGNCKTGEVLCDMELYVDPYERLSDRIITLTGITEEDIRQKGMSLMQAYSILAENHVKHNSFINPLTWGGGDSAELRKQIGNPEKWPFGRRWVDVKTVFQFYCWANNLKSRAGLAKAMRKLGMDFSGKKHNGRDDAYNTFRVYCHLLDKLKNPK